MSEGGYKEGEGDPRDPKPSPSEIGFRSIPISAEVCASEESAEESERGDLKKRKKENTERGNVTQARIQK